MSFRTCCASAHARPFSQWSKTEIQEKQGVSL